MRTSNVGALLGLALLTISTAGCCCIDTCPSPGNAIGDLLGKVRPPGGVPYVVEIARSEEPSAVIGYMSIDPGDPRVAWWLMKTGEMPHTLPNDTASPADGVIFRATSGYDQKMNGATLCSTFNKPPFSNGMPKLWWTMRSPAGTSCP